MKKANKYSDELKEQIIRECQEVGNVAVVARRYEISSNTIHTWIKKYRERGTAKTLKKNGFKDLNTMTEQLKKVSTENDQLKRLGRKGTRISNPTGRDKQTPVADRAAIAE